jgi:hypothetical protein
MPLNKTNPNFPAPYVNDTKETDPMIIRVDVNKTEIGARPSGLPKDVKNSNNVEHVDNRSTGKG